MTAIPSRLELHVGEQRAIELPGLGTAGYVWDDDVIGDDGVVEVQWTRGFPPGSPARPVGVSAAEVATIRAVRPGAVEVRLYQHRRWEPADRVRVEHRLSVIVRQG
jgi:predicted secreted protein